MVNITNAISSVSPYQETHADYENYGRWINQLQQKMQEISEEQQHNSSSDENKQQENEQQPQLQSSQQNEHVKADGVNRPTTHHRLNTYI